MSTQTLTPRIVHPGQGRIINQMGGEQLILLLAGEQTGGTLAMFIDETPPGSGPPLHIHHNEDETCYVLEGEYEILVGDERITVSAGGSAFL